MYFEFCTSGWFRGLGFTLSVGLLVSARNGPEVSIWDSRPEVLVPFPGLISPIDGCGEAASKSDWSMSRTVHKMK